jgi:hypothetical protein
MFIFILTLFVVQQAWSEEADEKVLSTSGNIRIRTQSEQFTDFSSLRDYSILRIRGNFTIKPETGLKIFIQPQFSKYFGQQDYVSSGATSNTLTTTSSGLWDDNVILHQGYFDYSISENLFLSAGRITLSYGDELVIGVNDWSNIGRSFDAFKVKYIYSLGYTDLFTSKINETNVTAASAGNNDFYGLYNVWSLGEYAKAFDTYFFYSRDSRNGIPLDLDLWTMGARVKSAVESLDYRAEGNVQTGSISQNYVMGGLFDAEIGYKFSAIRFAVEGFTASEKYNQLYPTAHKWLGYEDVISRKNITGGAVTALYTANKLTTELGAQAFYRTVSTASAYNYTGGALGTASASAAMDVGTEFDLTVKYKVSEHFVAQTGASLFQPGNYLKDQNYTQSPVFYYLQGEATF